jgi:hypothetical protein
MGSYCHPTKPSPIKIRHWNCNYMFSIHSNLIVINEVQYLEIMCHIQSSNSFFNNKTLHMTVVN